MRKRDLMTHNSPDNELIVKAVLASSSTVTSEDAILVVEALTILKFAQNLTSIGEKHFSRYGLSQVRFSLLMQLNRGGKWTPAMLANALNITRASVTKHLENLESSGWIVRKKNDDDGRSSLVCFTTNGRRKLKKAIPDHYQRVLKLMSPLTQSDRVGMQKIVGKLNAAIRDLESDDHG